MLERENIDNFIADDLALRNRNWGQIEDWQNGAVKLTNLIENGDFGNGADGWRNHGVSVGGSTREIVIEDGKPAAKIFRSLTQTGGFGYRKVMSFTVGDVFYLNVEAKVDALTERPFIAIYSPGTEMFGNYGNLDWQILSSIFIPNSDRTELVVAQAGSQGGVTAWYRNVILVNLTATFGAGNEPTKEEMDELIRLIGWFDGEISLSQKQVAIWTLNMIRKNRNAIVALGGTIA